MSAEPAHADASLHGGVELRNLPDAGLHGRDECEGSPTVFKHGTPLPKACGDASSMDLVRIAAHVVLICAPCSTCWRQCSHPTCS